MNRSILFVGAIVIALRPAPVLSQSVSAAAVFPAVGLAISQPQGFEKSTSFSGFAQSSTQSSVVLMSIPGPFSKISAGFSSDNLSEGLKTISKVNVIVDKQPAILLQLSQNAYSQEFLKWVVIFGSETQTYLVTATFPKAYADQLSSLLKHTVLTVSTSKLHQDASTLPFVLDPAPGLSFVEKIRSMGKVMALTQDGELHPTSPSDPLLVIAQSLGPVQVLDRRFYAIQRLKQTAQTRIQAIKSVDPVTINGQDGYEILATGTDLKTGVPLRIYQVILFTEAGGYVLMTGLVGADRESFYIPKFKATVKTYRTRTEPKHGT
jgi:hypothetical protein